MNLKTTWYRGLSEQEKEEIILSFNASGRLRSRLIKILEEKIETIRKERVGEKGYEAPSWALKQADAVGYERNCREIISLLTSEV